MRGWSRTFLIPFMFFAAVGTAGILLAKWIFF